MKYLAAYALLTLSGKKEISMYFIMQPLKISNLSSVASHANLMMLKSKLFSPMSRENLSINSLLTETRDSEDQHQPLKLQLQERNNNPRRNKSQRRKSNLKRKNNPYQSQNKIKIWEDSSIDRFIEIFKSIILVSY